MSEFQDRERFQRNLLKIHLLPGQDGPIIQTIDDKGAGGAYHAYEIGNLNLLANPSAMFDASSGLSPDVLNIFFQNGPVPTNGINGVTLETLITICIHRLACFQLGSYPCDENGQAIVNLKQALFWLQSRTQDRIRREVEGKLES